MAARIVHRSLTFRLPVSALAAFGALLALLGDSAFVRAGASAEGWSPEQVARDRLDDWLRRAVGRSARPERTP